MTNEPRKERHSHVLEPELITDPQLKAEAEAANGLRQYDYAEKSVHQALERSPFKLRPSLVYGLQREALQGISAYAGVQRPGNVEIINSQHEPVGAHLVPEQERQNDQRLENGKPDRVSVGEAVAPCLRTGVRESFQFTLKKMQVT